MPGWRRPVAEGHGAVGPGAAPAGEHARDDGAVELAVPDTNRTRPPRQRTTSPAASPNAVTGAAHA